jgi:hypothetical protein
MSAVDSFFSGYRAVFQARQVEIESLRNTLEAVAEIESFPLRLQQEAAAGEFRLQGLEHAKELSVLQHRANMAEAESGAILKGVELSQNILASDIRRKNIEMVDQAMQLPSDPGLDQTGQDEMAALQQKKAALTEQGKAGLQAWTEGGAAYNTQRSDLLSQLDEFTNLGNEDAARVTQEAIDQLDQQRQSSLDRLHSMRSELDGYDNRMGELSKASEAPSPAVARLIELEQRLRETDPAAAGIARMRLDQFAARSSEDPDQRNLKAINGHKNALRIRQLDDQRAMLPESMQAAHDRATAGMRKTLQDNTRDIGADTFGAWVKNTPQMTQFEAKEAERQSASLSSPAPSGSAGTGSEEFINPNTGKPFAAPLQGMMESEASVASLMDGYIQFEGMKKEGWFGRIEGPAREQAFKLLGTDDPDMSITRLAGLRASLAPAVSRSLQSQVGVLTDSDIANAEKLIPLATDTPEIAQAKKAFLLSGINSSAENVVNQFIARGSDAQGVINRFQARGILEGYQVDWSKRMLIPPGEKPTEGTTSGAGQLDPSKINNAATALLGGVTPAPATASPGASNPNAVVRPGQTAPSAIPAAPGLPPASGGMPRAIVPPRPANGMRPSELAPPTQAPTQAPAQGEAQPAQSDQTQPAPQANADATTPDGPSEVSFQDGGLVSGTISGKPIKQAPRPVGIDKPLIKPKAIVFHASAATQNHTQLINSMSREGYHFTIDKDGTVAQHWPLDRIASHAREGGYNWRSIGISLVGTDNDKGKGKRYIDGDSRTTLPATKAQLKSARELVKKLRDIFPTLSEFKGHGETDPANRAGDEGLDVAEAIRQEMSKSKPTT